MAKTEKGHGNGVIDSVKSSKSKSVKIFY